MGNKRVSSDAMRFLDQDLVTGIIIKKKKKPTHSSFPKLNIIRVKKNLCLKQSVVKNVRLFAVSAKQPLPVKVGGS